MTQKTLPDWGKQKQEAIHRISQQDKTIYEFATANAATVSESIKTAKAVVNIASEHVPNFCERSKNGTQPAYLNCYDLGSKTVRLGDACPDTSWERRELVDFSLLSLHGTSMKNVYFAAVETNGTGVMFYGDICLVLETIPDETIVLDRNSYDLTREPIVDTIEQPGLADEEISSRRAQEARKLAGLWGSDLGSMASIKTLNATGGRNRRLTSGQISAGVLDDEDYMEVLKIGSFTTNDLECARLSAADVALENYIAQRIGSASTPSYAEHLWLHQRQEACRSLEEMKVPVPVVTRLGRTKV